MKRFLTCFVGVMLFTVPTYASTYNDTNGHWAEAQIDTLTNYSLLSGFDGNFRPDEYITRGEMAVIIDRLMSYEITGENTFSDLGDKFYKDAILKTNKAGVIYGDNGIVRPDDNITRAEAVAMIYRAFDMKTKGQSDFNDSNTVPSWAKTIVSSLKYDGIISGDKNGNFNPNNYITRSEVATIFDKILGNVYNKEGTYSENSNKDVVINTSNVTLQNCIVEGDLYLAPGIKNGDVILDNVTVLGETYVWGGGENSIHVNGSNLGNVNVDRAGGSVRVVADSSSNISNVSASGNTILDGSMSNVTVNGGNVTVRGNVGNLRVSNNANSPSINVEKSATVKQMQIGGKTNISVDGKVDSINVQASAEGTSIEGAGTVSSVVSMASSVTQNGKSVPVSSTSSSSSNNYSGGSITSSNNNNNNNQTQEDITISNVEAVQNGLVRVTLTKATKNPLPKANFSIICTGGGSDMTILDVSTRDNRVYDLRTAYYDDNTYNLEVTLESGKRINKDFESKFNCAQIDILSIDRTSDTTATIDYNTDVRGEFYYVLEENAKSRTFSARSGYTPSEIIKNGTKVDMVNKHETLNLTGLKPNTSYTMYYVVRDTQYGYERITPTKALQITSKVNTPSVSDITIQNLDYGFRIDGFENTEYWFTATLSKPTEQKLTLDNFTLSCPKGNFRLGKVETSDNQTYKVYLQQGSIPFSNINVTMKINFPSGEITQKSVYFDTNAPQIDYDSWKWTSPTTADVNLRSDEAGEIYYKIYNQVESSVGVKDPTEIYNSGTRLTLSNGANILKLENLTQDMAGKYFCFATKDAKGNQVANYMYKQIPVYTEPELPSESDAKITNVEISQASPTGFDMVVTFDKQVTWQYRQGETLSITGLNKFLARAVGGTNTRFEIYVGAPLEAGEHTLTMTLEDGKQVTKTFNVDTPIH